MQKTIVFIKYSPLTEKVYDDLCMDALVKEGYIVQYWDITLLYSFKLDLVEHFSPDNIKIINVKNYEELKSLAKQNTSTFYISLMTPGLNQVKLLRALANNHSIISFWGPDPVFYKQNTSYERFRRITWRKLIWFIKHCICIMFFRKLVIQNYEYYFNVGEKGYQSLGSIDEKSKSIIKKLQVNSFDYNRYIYKQSTTTDLINEKYILFLDQYYPFHPDFIICGYKQIPYKQYFEQLNQTFKRLEEMLNMKVVIAAHPKSLKYKEEDFFNGRNVYWGMSGELTKNATYVMTHDSTAISYAMMAHKPVIILTSSLISKYYPVNHNNSVNLADEFGFNVFNMDKMEQVQSISYETLELNSWQIEKYNKHLYGYCTSPEIHDQNSALLISYIEDIFHRH